MGKVTGFMEFERIEEGYKPVPERVKHYKEFVIGLDDAQAKVQGAGQMRPVNSGKLLVESSTAKAFCQSSRYTRSLKSGMMLLTGQPELQKGMPQSMQRAACTFACLSSRQRMNSL